ncbi:MAG: hypothetical protein F4X65_08945 [Chloroflexi bacterium]|nr:hypothetical protein [Chloroflexota bacterium]
MQPGIAFWGGKLIIGNCPQLILPLVVLVLLALLLACGAHTGGLRVPEREFLYAYEGFGNQLQHERKGDFEWKDGSGWHDGISSTPPPLPIPAGDVPSTVMTCAQEEVVNMIAFPDGVGPHEAEEKQLSRAEEARLWESNFSVIVWGEDYPQAGEWRAQDSFNERCIIDP